MSDKVNKKKVAGLIHTGEGDSKRNGKSSKRGVFERIGAYLSSHWIYSAVISPIVLIVCIGLLFSIKGNKRGKE